jgi:hypothetical protein
VVARDGSLSNPMIDTIVGSPHPRTAPRCQ